MFFPVDNKTVLGSWGIVCLGVLLCLALPRSFVATAAGDLIQCLLLTLLMSGVLRRSALGNVRARAFWLLFSIGCTLWLAAQLLWTYFEVVRRHEVPNPFIGDVALFLHLVPIMAAFLVRQDNESRMDGPNGTDFALLLVWWTYLYLFVVIPWQYVSPDQELYGSSFDILYLVEHAAVLLIAAVSWYRSTCEFRPVCRRLFAACLLYAFASLTASVAIDYGLYYTGSIFDIPLLIAFGMFVQAAVMDTHVTSSADTTVAFAQEARAVSLLANAAAFSLPLFAAWAAFWSTTPEPVRRFRVALTLGTIVVIGALRSAKQFQLQTRLTRVNGELEHASVTDSLTGVRNRRFFADTIDNDVQQIVRLHLDKAGRHNSDLIFYLIDIDHFKEINDTFGHEEGDDVLVQIAFRISAAIRHSDVLVRWGGEEFLVVSRFTDRGQASVLCGRILESIAGDVFELRNGRTIYRTCSIGWAAFPWFPDRPQVVSYQHTLRLADAALYTAKRNGRNQGFGVVPPADSGTIGDDVKNLPTQLVRTMGPSIRSAPLNSPTVGGGDRQRRNTPAIEA